MNSLKYEQNITTISKRYLCFKVMSEKVECWSLDWNVREARSSRVDRKSATFINE